MDNIKVYRMDDYEWWASKWNIKKTNDFFNKEYGTDNEIESIKEVDIDKDGTWYETTEEKHIQKLGGSDEVIGIEVINGQHKRKVQFGNLMRREGCVYVYTSFREVLQLHGDFEEPYMIATTEW